MRSNTTMAVANEVAQEPAVRRGESPQPAAPGAPAPQQSSDGSVERERLRMMMLIRRFEERTFQEYTKPGQKIGGFCHLYSGQEAVAVGIAALYQKGKDY